MIIPIKCFTCNKVLADKWEYYVKECEKKEIKQKKDREMKQNNETGIQYFDGNFSKDILDSLGLTKQCCRRHFLGHVDLIETI